MKCLLSYGSRKFSVPDQFFRIFSFQTNWDHKCAMYSFSLFCVWLEGAFIHVHTYVIFELWMMHMIPFEWVEFHEIFYNEMIKGNERNLFETYVCIKWREFNSSLIMTYLRHIKKSFKKRIQIKSAVSLVKFKD